MYIYLAPPRTINPSLLVLLLPPQQLTPKVRVGRPTGPFNTRHGRKGSNSDVLLKVSDALHLLLSIATQVRFRPQDSPTTRQPITCAPPLIQTPICWPCLQLVVG